MISKAEKQKWQAEEDASVMACYQEIIGDKARMNRAIKVAQQRAKEYTTRANLMQNIAKAKPSKGKK